MLAVCVWPQVVTFDAANPKGSGDPVLVDHKASACNAESTCNVLILYTLGGETKMGACG